MFTLFIKNMVCNRCIMIVKQEMDKIALQVLDIKLGEIVFDQKPDNQLQQQIANALTPLGFELLDDRKSTVIEQVKRTIINWVQAPDEEQHLNLSALISKALQLDYTYVSNLFSDIEGSTIEQYFIAQKIEKVKELLVYDEYTLTEIADRLQYSSVAYLSNQFKKVTGLTPSHFKKIKENKRKPLDEV